MADLGAEVTHSDGGSRLILSNDLEEETMASADFSFKRFGEQGFYRSVNKRAVDLADIRSGQRIVELACGTGAVTRLILDKLKGARDSVVIGIDQSAIGLKQAMQDLGNVRDATVQFVQTRMERISEVVKGSADRVILCNAIHYIPDKGALVSEISKTLKPGGMFVFNTSFFEGGHPAETEQFYRRWMMKALRILKSEYGLRPSKAEKVESRKQLTPEEYSSLLTQQGFHIAKQQIYTAEVPLEGWLDISQFEDFIVGAMPGVPLPEASNSLKKGAIETFADMKISFVPRNWLEVVAVKA